MKTELEKMLAGEWYRADDEQLLVARDRAHDLCQQYNQLSKGDLPEAQALIHRLIPQCGEGVYIQPPFFCDYGTHIELGDGVYFNSDCVLLDCARIKIGARSKLAPKVQVYTPGHPLNAEERASALEFAKPIIIGEDVWVGGGVVIVPGVTIGDRSVIGAGSVVTKDIPSDVIAVGNPCRVLRPITESDLISPA